MAKEKTDNERFVELGWLLHEHKCRYYYLKRAIIADEEYDKLEEEYKALAAKLGLNPYVSEMVGFDPDRASSQMVLHKLTGGKA